jgi:hypothetical protein
MGRVEPIQLVSERTGRSAGSQPARGRGVVCDGLKGSF